MRSKKLVEFTDEDEQVALFLTTLLAQVNQAIDPGTTYELVLQMLLCGTDEMVALEYGDLIRATAFTNPNGTKH